MYSLDDTDELGVNAPRPLDTATMDKGAFTQLSDGQGAKAARRADASSAGSGAGAGMSRRTIVVLVVAALAVIALGIVLLVRVLNSPLPVSPDHQAMRMEAPVDASVAYNGSTYSLSEKDGAYSLVETHVDGDGQSVVVGALPGTPVGIMLFDGAVLIPENLPDGTWEVSAYTIGSGWSPISGRDGSSSGGQGTISEAHLDGSTLRLVVDGQPTEVALVW